MKLKQNPIYKRETSFTCASNPAASDFSSSVAPSSSLSVSESISIPPHSSSSRMPSQTQQTAPRARNERTRRRRRSGSTHSRRRDLGKSRFFLFELICETMSLAKKGKYPALYFRKRRRKGEAPGTPLILLQVAQVLSKLINKRKK